jgi:hypothetical protein
MKEGSRSKITKENIQMLIELCQAFILIQKLNYATYNK